MDVLRAAQHLAQYRRRLFLARAGQGRSRPAAARARGLDGRGLPLARGDGESPQAPSLLRGRPLLRRRHRALRLHASGAPVRLRSHDLSSDPRLARPRRGAAGPYRHGVAAGERGGGGVIAVSSLRCVGWVGAVPTVAIPAETKLSARNPTYLGANVRLTRGLTTQQEPRARGPR